MNITALRMMFFVLLSTVININAMDSEGARPTKEGLYIQQVINDYRNSLLELHKVNESEFERAWQFRIFAWKSIELGSMIKEVVRWKKVGELETLRHALKDINSEFATYSSYGVLYSPIAIDNLLLRPDLDEIVEQRIQKNGVSNPKIGITFTKEPFCRKELQINKGSNKYQLLVDEVKS